MIDYKGYKFPTLNEFKQHDEEYTDPTDASKWQYKVGGILVKIPKEEATASPLYIVDTFKNFVDVVYPDATKVVGAVEDMISDVSIKNKKIIDQAIAEKMDKEAEEKGIDKDILAAATSNDPNQLTDEQISKINDAYNKALEESDELKTIADLPSNNGVEERDPEDITETGEFKDMNVSVDPVSGEHKILGDASDLLESETFEEMLDRINSDDLTFGNDEPLSEEEIQKYLDPENATTSYMINEVINKDYPLSKDAVKQIMNIANRRMKKEDFNIYKEYPDEVKKMVYQYMENAGARVPMNSNQLKAMRNRISESLIDDFINNIAMDRATSDFNKEVQEIFDKNATDVSEVIVGYSKDKIESYRKSLDKIEDPSKRERLEKVLERIDDGYNLTSLKEFAKHCRIKRFDLEKPQRVLSGYRAKYEKSAYDTFSIDMARPILYRHLNPEDKEEYTQNDVLAFFLAFAKHTANYQSDDILDHAYMYYVIYNIVLTDINKAENTKATSDQFLDNVKEVIHNLRESNTHLKGE